MSDYISREDVKKLLWERISLATFMRRGIPNAMKSLSLISEELEKIPAADVWPLQAGENITENNPVDEFVCSECGIILEDWSRVEIDDDDGERTNHEYVFRYCPNCGKPMK